jgi:hypothetical protein
MGSPGGASGTGNPGASLPPPESGPAARTDAEIVMSWLERHPPQAGVLALASVRSALEAAAPAPVARGASAGSALSWMRSQSALAKTSLAVALTLAMILIGQNLGTRQPANAMALEGNLALSELASKITSLSLEERRFEKDSFIHIQDPALFSSYEKRWNDSRLALSETIDRAGRIDMTEADRRAIEEIDSDFRAYAFGYERVVAQIRSGRIQTAQQANDALEVYKNAVHRVEANGAAITERAASRLGKLT